MIIIGAGMSGMLAAHYFRHLNPSIIEKQESLPNNHKALLRFRSESVSDLTGIPFKKVKVSKSIVFDGASYGQSNLMLNNLYSQKVTGAIRSRSIGNMEDCERFIAPEDFINKLSNGLDIEYDRTLDSKDLFQYSDPIISTMPVYALAYLLGYDGLPELKSREIWTLSFDMEDDIDIYQTIYYPSLDQPIYRLSITGRKVIAEFSEEITSECESVLFNYIAKALSNHFGIDYRGDPEVDINYQKYGKLIECDDNSVKTFIGWASSVHNIYSLGRWGTHRQILMDDVVKDIKSIDKLIRSNGYRI